MKMTLSFQSSCLYLLHVGIIVCYQLLVLYILGFMLAWQPLFPLSDVLSLQWWDLTGRST